MGSPETSTKRFDPKEYWESRLSDDFALQGVGYSLLGQHYNEWMYRVRRRVFLREARLVRRHWNSAQILDIGSGTGFYLQRWQELGATNISGADMTSVAVSNLARTFPEFSIHQLDIGENDSGALGKFDAISIFDVLFHIVEEDRFLTAVRNLGKLIRPGGYLFLSDNFIHVNPTRSDHHVSRAKTVIEDSLVESGFEIVRRRPMFVLMNEPVDTTSPIRHLAWKVFLKCVSQSELLGNISGALLYPLELTLTRFCDESATTEMMICRKRSDRDD
jgi:SAM-dependent methyltransferase